METLNQSLRLPEDLAPQQTVHETYHLPPLPQQINLQLVPAPKDVFMLQREVNILLLLQMGALHSALSLPIRSTASY